MFNPYGIIAVNPAKHLSANYKGAMQLTEWITSDEGQKAIAYFKVDGQQVFFPSAKSNRFACVIPAPMSYSPAILTSRRSSLF